MCWTEPLEKVELRSTIPSLRKRIRIGQAINQFQNPAVQMLYFKARIVMFDSKLAEALTAGSAP
jgi:hypothetical protein